MLFQGTFESAGVRYTTYRLVTKGVDRLDIMEDGAEFQVDSDKVIYGLWKRKITYQYGDVDLFRRLENLKNTLEISKGETDSVVEWIDGSIYQTLTKTVNMQCMSKTVMINGKRHSTEYRILNEHFYETCVSPDFNMVLEPVNMVDYQRIEVAKTVALNKVKTPIVPLAIIKQRRDLSWDKLVNYRIITSVEDAEDYITFLHSQRGEEGVIHGFDFETTGKTFNCYESDKVVGLVVNHTANQSVYFPFAHEGVDWNLPWEIFEKLLDALRDQVNCAHFKKFERKVLMSIGHRYFPIQHDSMIVSFLNNPVLQKGQHALKNLGEAVTGWQFIELEHIFTNKSQIDFSKIDDPEIARLYACPDADSCVKVLHSELGKLPPYTRAIYDLECELADLKAEQEYWGFRIAYDKLYKDAENCNDILLKLKRILLDMTHSDVDLNSPQSLANLFYEKLKCPVLVRTKTHQASTGAKARKKLARERRSEPLTAVHHNIVDSYGNTVIKAEELNNAKYPPIIVLNAYRDYAKLSSAFYARFLNAKYKDRYFSWINQHGADTGRQSSPMHQLPKKIKACILADSEDHLLVDADYSQVELRILASAAGERDLVEEMKDPGKDIHRIIANKISGVPMYLISSAMRQGFKATNFGVVYLISGRGLAEQRFGVGCGKDKIRECEDSIMDFYRTFKRIKLFNEKSRRNVLATGKAHTKFYRTRLFPEISMEGLPEEEKESIIRKATNMPIQGTAADIMKKAEVNLNNYIRARGWDELVDTPQGRFPLVRVMLSAHDEVLISMHKTLIRNVPEVYSMIKECMEMQIEDWAPLYTSTCIVENWEEGKDDRYAVPIELRDKIIEEGTLMLGDNPKEEMLAILQQYRENEVLSYVDRLIEEVGDTNPAVIAKAVTDDVLTHSLIERFGPSKKWLAKNGELDQLGLILYSVKACLEYREGKLVEREEPVEDVSAEVDIETTIREVMDLSEEIYEFDADGNIIGVAFEEAQPEEEEFELFSEEDRAFFAKLEDDKEFIIIELLNVAIVDTAGLSYPDCNKLLELLNSFRDEDGLSKFYLMHNGSMVDTTIRFEKYDRQAVIDWIDQRRQVRANV